MIGKKLRLNRIKIDIENVAKATLRLSVNIFRTDSHKFSNYLRWTNSEVINSIIIIMLIYNFRNQHCVKLDNQVDF